ncbi:MAG: hypothetical protein GIKADHBN_00067 [Phycisphaerales bacterium]|nr:hypothetical protein [Phycisphaerales bacterium]
MRQSLVVSLLFMAASTVAGESAWAQHKWYQGGKDRGFQNSIPDFYQHQYYKGDMADAYQTWYPDKTNYPKWGQLGGLCYQVALTNAVASWEPYGYKGATNADTLTEDKWRDAYRSTVEDVTKAGGDMQKYLDDRKAANAWKRRLLYNQYTMESDGAGGYTGTVLTPSGKKIQQPKKMGGGFETVSVFDTYKRMMLNEASVTLLVDRDDAKTYSDTLWWGNYHAVTGAGFDGKTGEIYFADPDSNKGNRSAKAGYEIGSSESADAGDGGWVFEETKRGEADPLKRFKFVDPVSGAEVADVKDGKKFTLLELEDDGMGGVKIVKNDYGGAGGPLVNIAKGADENINKRKYGAADKAVPIPGRPKQASDPTDFNKYYGAFKVDNSAADKAFTIKGSDDFDRNITDKGRYTDTRIMAMDVIHPAGLNELGKVKDATGVTTDIKLASISTLPVDRIQLCSVNTAAQYDPSIDGRSFFDSDGGMWTASFMWPTDPGVTDAMGNSLFGLGGWEFTLTMGDGLAGFTRGEEDIQTELVASIRTVSDLVQFDLLMHSMEITAVDDDLVPYTIGDFWSIQSFGFGGVDRGLQYGFQPEVPAPGTVGLALLGVAAMGRRRR